MSKLEKTLIPFYRKNIMCAACDVIDVEVKYCMVL